MTTDSVAIPMREFHHTSSRQVRGKVWKSGSAWFYEVLLPDGAIILQDNTGNWKSMYRAAAIRVETVRHMIIAGLILGVYDPDKYDEDF